MCLQNSLTVVAVLSNNLIHCWQQFCFVRENIEPPFLSSFGWLGLVFHFLFIFWLQCAQFLPMKWLFLVSLLGFRCCFRCSDRFPDSNSRHIACTARDNFVEWIRVSSLHRPSADPCCTYDMRCGHCQWCVQCVSEICCVPGSSWLVYAFVHVNQCWLLCVLVYVCRHTSVLFCFTVIYCRCVRQDFLYYSFMSQDRDMFLSWGHDNGIVLTIVEAT